MPATSVTASFARGTGMVSSVSVRLPSRCVKRTVIAASNFGAFGSAMTIDLKSSFIDSSETGGGWKTAGLARVNIPVLSITGRRRSVYLQSMSISGCTSFRRSTCTKNTLVTPCSWPAGMVSKSSSASLRLRPRGCHNT